jgi:hypothetical protein
LPRTATLHDLDGRSVFITGGGSDIGTGQTLVVDGGGVHD